MKPPIQIRADGSPSIGLGHLVRCSALAHMLKDDFRITFFCREIPEQLATEFVNSGFELQKIINEDEFLNALSPNHIAVLDGYGFDTDYQRKIKNTGCKLVCIDDLHDREFLADLIINHAPGITPQNYKAQPYTLFALGPDYALLRPAFLEQAKKERKIEKIETLLIAFGGADPKRLTEKTLGAAVKFREFKKIIVVTGAAFETSDAFLQLLADNQRVDHQHALNEEQMLNAMLEADLAIVPASGILFEALAADCHVISGHYTKNQYAIYRGFKEIDCFFDCGSFDDINACLPRFLDIYKNYNKANPIDGQSKRRLNNAINTLIND